MKPSFGNILHLALISTYNKSKILTVKTQILVEQHLTGITDGGLDVNVCLTF